MKKTALADFVLAVSIPLAATAQAHDRREAAITASTQAQAVQGGSTIEVAGSYDAVFDGLVTYLKKCGYSVEGASKESGLVTTSIGN